MTGIKKTNVLWRLFGDSFLADLSGIFMSGVVAIIINSNWITLIRTQTRFRTLSIIRILRKQKSRCFLVRVLDVIEAGCRNKELLSNGLIVCGYMASNSQYSILKIGDVIKEVNGKPCKNYADVRYKDGSVYTIYRLNNKGDFEEMKVTISKDQPIMVFMAF